MDEQHVKILKRASDTTRSLRSTEDGVTTLIDCFEALTTALGQLSKENSDSATVSSALGLEKRLHDVSVIVCLFLLRTIFGITSPVSRLGLLQGVAVDLAISATLIEGVLKSLQEMRDAPDQTWTKLMSESTAFAEKRNICPLFAEKRRRKIWEN